MRALLCAALVALWAQCTQGFFFHSPGSYREARQNYHEIMTNCEREGGDCVDADFGTTDPPPPPPTLPPSTLVPTPRPTTPAPPPPVNYPLFFWNPFWQFLSHVPTPAPIRYTVGATRAPKPMTRAPRPGTSTPRPTTRTPKPTKRPPATKKRRKVGKGKRRQRNRGEEERESRQRRQVDPWDYLYSECPGGWEFDLGCSARGANVCCYSSNSGSSTK